MKHIAYILTAILLLAHTAAAQPETQKVGLVLSGGGAKGIAHIGVIQALEDNDIAIDYVTGTSMGAIVGGLYAAGYTPQEMMQLILSPGFGYWSTGQNDPSLTDYFNSEIETPAMFSVPIQRKNAKKVPVYESIISPMPMSFAFMELFSPYTAACGGDFDRLFVPFRCVASDVDAHRKKVLSSGNVGDAIRASMSFPIVFQPITIDSTLLYDGGIYDNFPVDVMRETFKPSIMFGVDVHTASSGPQTSIMDQIDNLVIQNNDYSLPEAEGIKLHIDLNEFGLLDFPQAQAIYRIGYAHAIAIMDSIKERISARRSAAELSERRKAFKARVPSLAFDSVVVSGGTRRENDYIRYLFRPKKGCDTIGVDRARKAFYSAISTGKLRDLAVTATPKPGSEGLFRLNLRAAPKANLYLSGGGYITSSTSSYLYGSLRYGSIGFSSIDASLDGWIGQSTMAGVLRARFYLHTALSSAIDLLGVASRSRYTETERMFFDDSKPSFIVDREYFGRAAWSFPAGRSAQISIGAGYGAIRTSFFPVISPDAYEEGRDRADFNLGQILARFTSSTLNDINYSTSGHSYRFTAMGLLGNDNVRGKAESSIHTRWMQAEIETRNFWPFGRHFSLGVESDVLLSTRKLLSSYSASLAVAPAFTPTASSASAFNPTFRANSFIGLGVVPVYRYNDNLSVRLSAYGFMPLRRIVEAGGPIADVARFSRYFDHLDAWVEAAAAYRFHFATLSGYVNYTTAPGDRWHVGLALGIYILPPKFLR